MSPLFPTDPNNPLAWIVAFLWALYLNHAPDPFSPASLAQWFDVLNLRAFAGQFWRDATGYAQGWARICDNLIDLIDPFPSIRGDH